MGMGCFCFGGSPAMEKDPHQQGYSSGKNITLFSYDELKAATRNFNESSKIGRGGFGTVYKGTLKNRIEVAVKTLSAESRQGIQEFLTEIDTITNVKHTNLVELIGCCVQGSNRVLVYEYLENNSLDRLLLGPKDKKANLDWSRRSAICMGTARGLAFLHEEVVPPIVHRDIKASNILLDGDLVPKIGDFGLAKLFPDNVTHLSTRVAGTVGYLAPEYAMRGQLTKKADIYSFGVLMLEIVSGRSSAKSNWSETQKFLLELTWELYQEGRLLEMVDPDLEQYPEEEVLRYMKIALFCTQSAAKRRPSMTQVVSMLSKRSNLNEKLLTAPGIIQDLIQVSKPTAASRSENPTSPLEPNSSAIDSSAPPTSSPVSFTDMSPR